MRIFVLFLISFIFLHSDTFDKIEWLDMLECKISHEEYWDFAYGVLQNENSKKRLGMQKIKQDNPFIEEYKLSIPITIYGYTTDHIAFTSAGVMAIVDEKNPKQLAKKLNMNIEFDSGDKILATKIISPSEPKYFDPFLALDLSTITSHPNKTLIGCSYIAIMKDKNDE